LAICSDLVKNGFAGLVAQATDKQAAQLSARAVITVILQAKTTTGVKVVAASAFNQGDRSGIQLVTLAQW